MRILEDQEIRKEDIRLSGNQAKKETGCESEVKAGFEKLWVWQKAHQLMLDVHRLCRTLPREERFRLRDQIERSSSSVPDNIAEGYTSYYYLDKIKGFRVARKEAGETQNHIRSFQGKNYIVAKIADDFIKRYEEVIKGINGFVNFIREKSGCKR